jgi:hypothetical protein
MVTCCSCLAAVVAVVETGGVVRFTVVSAVVDVSLPCVVVPVDVNNFNVSLLEGASWYCLGTSGATGFVSDRV